ncbi:DUF1601 domain-containing protein [Endozoicomonas sp. GU-1]|uniref:DUF1601 domain-containing protein n=1 Tax=Endozoicomonas sp. GU-1 TaxID=3009078 RepID=UPI0022B2C121|nr:DUF1601 domain-containing protein [Endozoicomonas sp. GU-1]WBA82144.1 DUF1601 domain-containing protein [Endozoicomonas sp. GU-1]
MDSAGISWTCTTSGNDYNQPDDHTGASGSGRYRYGKVRRTNTSLPYIPERHEFYPAANACSAHHPPGHSIKPVQDFKALVTQATMDDLVRTSTQYGDRYNGKKHSQFACSIKQYTSRSKRPLNRSEQCQLIPLLHAFKVTPGWPWQSLTTTVHSFTSAGVFTPHKYLNERHKEAQAALLSTLLDAVIVKCQQKPEARDIDAQGTANLLWALAKMVGNGLGLEKTPKLKEAVAALLPLVKIKAESKEGKDHFIPQHIANQLWAVAKLVDNGLELEKTPKLKEVVAALLLHVKTKAKSKEEKDHFRSQGTANLLWALAKLVENGLDLEKTTQLKEAVAALLHHVKNKAESKEEKDHFKPQEVTNLLWAVAKLLDNGLKKTPTFREAVATLLANVKTKAESKAEKDHFIPQHITNLMWAVARLVDNGLALDKTPKLKEAVAALLPHVKTKAESKAEKDHFIPQHIANLLWAVAKLVDNGLEKTTQLKEAVAALLPHVKTKAESKAEKDHFIPQHIANLLWAVAKLVDNGLEKTVQLKEAVAALLPHVKTKAESKAEKDHFIPQHIANLLWAVAKLVENGLELEKTAKLKKALAALLRHVQAKAESKEGKGHFIPQNIANLLWAVAKLVDNGLEKTAKLKEAVAVLLHHVKAKAESKEEKDHFNTQATANLLWAVAKLVDNGLELEKTAQLKEVVAVLLPHVKVKAESKEEKDHFKPQEVASLLWAVAKLVDNGLELEKTPRLKEAVAWLLPYVKTYAESKEEKDRFSAKETANVLWAVAKLVDNGLELEKTPKLKEAVVALLPHVTTKAESLEETDHFTPQHIANQLWAVAKLVDNGLELEKTAKLKEALAALLRHVKAKAESKEEKNQFKPQEVANMMWAVAKLGEAIELNVVKSMLDSLVGKIGENHRLSQQSRWMSLWGVMAFCARFYLTYGKNNKNSLEKHIGELFSRLGNTPTGNTGDPSIIAMVTSWLGIACPVVPFYETIISQSQSTFCDQLRSSLPSLKIEEEKSLNSLPPVDLLLPNYNMVLDVQGPSHYVGGDFKTRNGSTLLKIALLKKLGFEVIEIPVNKLGNQKSRKRVIEQIKIKLADPPEAYDSVLHNSSEGSADEAYVTADEGGQFSDSCYFTAEEYLEEQTKKPKKRKRKRKKPVKTTA